MTRHVLRLGLIVAISVTLAVAGILKMTDFHGFVAEVYQYRLLPGLVALGLAFYLPFLEAATALGLWIPRLRAGAILLATTLFTVFSAALGSALIRGLDITCGCFGPGATTTALPALGRALVLLALCVVLACIERRKTAHT